jgi:hypothetical protein
MCVPVVEPCVPSSLKRDPILEVLPVRVTIVRRSSCTFGLWVSIIAIAPGNALAQDDPTVGVNRFPQFRNLSGLAGGGYGVNAQGYRSLDGPVALSTPVAYVLGRSQFRIGTARAAFKTEPRFYRAANGTSIFTYGHTLGRFNVSITDMILSGAADEAVNVQAQYISSPGALWTGSMGLQDVGGGGGSSGENMPGDTRQSRSFFAVATYRWDTGREPVFISLGSGTKRFRQSFASASTQVLKPLRIWVEHDGFGVNAGGLLTLNSGRKHSAVEWNFLYGMMKLKYAVGSIVIGF